MLYQIRRSAGLMTAAAAVYVGPGDIVGSATAWWGLRAYSAAKAGIAVINLRASGDNATSDFNTLSNGNLDVASISTFLTAHGGSLFIAELYDQTGGGNHLVQATAAAQPPFILSGIGSLPVLRNNINTQLVSGASITDSQPFTVSSCVNRTANFTTQQDVYLVSVQGGFASSANALYIFAGGSVPTASATDSTMHAVQWVTNGATSDINVDGTQNTVNATGGASMSGSLTYPRNNCTIDTMECGVWPVAFTPTQSSNMSANQHAYWGF